MFNLTLKTKNIEQRKILNNMAEKDLLGACGGFTLYWIYAMLVDQAKNDNIKSSNYYQLLEDAMKAPIKSGTTLYEKINYVFNIQRKTYKEGFYEVALKLLGKPVEICPDIRLLEHSAKGNQMYKMLFEGDILSPMANVLLMSDQNVHGRHVVSFFKIPGSKLVAFDSNYGVYEMTINNSNDMTDMVDFIMKVYGDYFNMPYSLVSYKPTIEDYKELHFTKMALLMGEDLI